MSGWRAGPKGRHRASRGLLSVVVAAIVVAGVVAGSGPASGASAPSHPPMLNPIGVANYLAAQRAGFGSPAHAAQLGMQALAQARKIRSRAIPTPAGTPNLSASWSALGPSPITQSFYGTKNTGRVDSLAVVQSGANAGEIFAGTAGGGVWSSTDNGATWTTATDHVPTGLAIGALAIDPTDPSIVYAGTGEANSCGDCFYGGGVLKSTDGGATWTVENPGGIFTGVDFASIAVDPNNDQNLFAGTSSGFYVSTDGGTSWAHPTGTGSFTDATYGIALDPTTSPTTVYIATSGVGIQKSTDGGTNFTTLSGLPAASNFGVTALGIGTKTSTYTTGNQVLYAAVQLNGTTDSNGGDLSMYKTTDGGTTWSQLTIPPYTNQSYAYGSGSSDQAWYDNTLAVDATDPSHVIAGGIAAVETTDGGSTWSNINGQNFFGAGTNVLHPDFHAVAFTASGNAVLGCDGGVFGYSGGGATHVTNLNTNQNTTQFYEGASVHDNGAQILGGLQDNGTVLDSGSSSWPDVNSGDGGYSAINPYDTNQQFGEADEHLYVTSDAWATASDITPSGEPDSKANFVPPMTIAPNASSPDAPTVYYGGGDLYVTKDPAGGSPTWTKLTSVGSGVSAIAVAPSNPDDLYVGFDDGTLLVSTNATSSSPTFTDISPGVGQWITHIGVDPSSPGAIAVSFSSSNTQYQSVAPMVETATVTLSGTPSATYGNITGDLPTGVASNSVVFDQGELVVATDVGVFFTTSPNGSSTTWSAAGTGLPNVQVIGLSVDANGTLYASTHGRGMWTLAVPPVVSGVSPPSGPTSGGTSVTITGTGFTGATAVEFGSTNATSYTIDSATQITATAPAETAATVDVTVAGPGGTSATSSNDHYTYVNPPETLSVSRSGSGSGSVSSSPSGVSCGSACSYAFGYGTEVTLSASPGAGSSFAGWSGACSGSGSCVVSMSQARSVAAIFSLVPETLSVASSGSGSGVVSSSPAGVSCGSACSYAFGYGTKVTLSVVAGAGSSFVGWSGACSGSGSCVVSMSQAWSVRASFGLVSEVLRVARRGHGRGRVVSVPAGITCGATCSHSYAYGSTVTLTAKAGKRSVFVGWSGACSGKAVCSLSLSAADLVRASFRRVCLVPRVKGERGRVARRRIKADGCRVGTVRRVFSARVRRGHVIAQKPRPHRRRKYHAEIKLVVSKGKKH